MAPLARRAAGGPLVRFIRTGLVAAAVVPGAACREPAVRPRDLPKLERPALDPRMGSVQDGPHLIRIDDLYGSFEWEGGDAGLPAAQRRGWEFEGSNEGWTFENGARPDVSAGRLRFRTRRMNMSLLSQPGLAIRFREIRAIEIRMSVSAGRRMTLSWSPDERFRDTFSVNADLRTGPEPAVYTVKASSLQGYEGLTLNALRLTPSDEAGADVQVDWIRLVPREGLYDGRGRGLGREEIANESRHVVYARTPASFTARVTVPPGGVLDAGAGVLDADPGVAFSVAVEDGGPRQTVIDREVTQDQQWEDMRADLSRWSGRSVLLRFSATSARPGSVALWANPALGSPEPAGGRPNVILYLIDTLRADHVGVYGARNDTTPAIDRMAKEGAYFMRCTAQAPWTRPSVASILTSLYPPEHGDIDQGDAVPDGVITLAEQLRRYGYLTAGFSVSSEAGSSANLDQGYDHFLEPPAILGAVPSLFDERSTDHSRATGAAINAKLVPWLERYRGRRLFVYVHSIDPHGPYLPAPPYDRIFDTGYRGRIDGSYDDEHGFEAAKTPDEVAHLKALYDGDIRCNDDAVGSLRSSLERLGLLENTIILVTSDHGEEFREHGAFQHGQSLYEELLRVPLVVRLPASMRTDPGGVRVDEPIETLDILPTLCAFAGIPAPPDALGRSVAQWLPAGGSGSARRRSAGVAATTSAAAVRAIPEATPHDGYGRAFAWCGGPQSEQVSVYDGRFKLIHRPALGDLLFDLSVDPEERQDLSREMPERAAALLASIESWWARRRRIVSPRETRPVVNDQE